MSFQDSVGATLTNVDGSFKLPRMQSVIALMFSGVVSFLWLTGSEVPDGLLNVTLIIVGFFFGDQSAERRVRASALPEPVSG